MDKPRRKRGVVRSASLPLEMLAMVCQHLHSSPRHVFLVVKAAKGLRALMTAEWWKRFWMTHMSVSNRRYRHYFLRDFTAAPLRPAQMSHVLRIVYGLRCECCGARWRHRIMDLLKLRICQTCVHDRFVSNRVLYYRFGLNAADILIEHGHLVTYTPLRACKVNDGDLRRMTRDPIDFGVFQRTKHHELMFLWRDDVAKLYDLEACAIDQRRRVGAIDALKARFRAARVRRVWSMNPRHALCVLLVPGVEVHVDPAWVVGGPTKQGRQFRTDPAPPKDNAVIRALQSKWDMMRVHIARPFLGFGEVSPKTWLEKFGGRVPPPDELKPSFVGLSWRFPRAVYDVRTLACIPE